MTHARWKMLAGFFGLSMCGLAALASASKSGQALGCHYSPDVKVREVAAVVPVQPVISAPVSQKIEAVANTAPINVPPIAPVMTIEEPTAIAPLLVLSPPLAIKLPEMSLPIPGGTIQQNDLPPEPIKLPIPAAAPNLSLELPAPSSPPLITLPSAGVVPVAQPVNPPSPIVLPVSPQPTALVLPSAPEVQPIPSTPSFHFSQPTPPPVVTTAPISPTPATQPVVKETTPEIQLTVRMSGATPSLELRSSNGSFISLKCDQLDIAARNPKDELPSTIRATGKVSFSASGCEGMCDELVFNPKTMEGTLKNAVRVKCTTGGAMTEFTADQIAFQLRSGSDMSITPTGGTTPARK